ncbi:MAG TPA: hypothetical protein PLF15_02330, partial [bacterium]|nr:hypothetical protein [bacterium]
MPEEITNTNVQNFMPEKKPNFWQRLGAWFRFLSPKSKILMIGAIIFGIAAIAVGAYFVFGAILTHPAEPDFYFEDSENNFVPPSPMYSAQNFADDIPNSDSPTAEINIEKRVNVMAYFDAKGVGSNNPSTYSAIRFKMRIRIEGAIDRARLFNMPGRCNPEGIDDTEGNGVVFCHVAIDNNDTIVTIDNVDDSGTGHVMGVSGNQEKIMATLNIVPLVVNDEIILTYENGSNFSEKNLIEWEGIDNNGNFVNKTSSNLNLYSATYRVIAVSGTGGTSDENIISLMPSVPSTTDEIVGINKNIKVKVLLKNLEADMVAFTADIKYDKELLRLDMVESTDDFPVTGDEKDDKENGIYTIVRGKTGNLSPDCAPDEVGCNKGKNVEVAILYFKTINVREGEDPSSAEIKIDGAPQVVVDDGQGQAIPLNIGDGSLIYQISKIGYNPDLYVTKGPDVYITKDEAGKWQAEIVWSTNVATDEGWVFYKDYENYTKIDKCNEVPSDALGNEKVAAEKISDTVQTGGPGFLVKQVGANQFKAVLTDLEKDQSYQYQIANKRNFSVPIRLLSGLEISSQGFVLCPAKTFIVKETSNVLAIKNLTTRGFYNNATVTWNTVGGPYSGLSDSAVAYVEKKVEDCKEVTEDEYTANIVVDHKKTLTHNIQLKNLKNNTTYCLKVLSMDEGLATATAYTEVATTKGIEDFDANVVLKVERDRQCDKWLYCRSSLEVINQKKEKENLCFDLGVCDEKDAEGNCVLTANFKDTGVASAEQVFKNPENVEQVRNLSGLSKVGMEWQDGEVIKGYFSYGAMSTVGVDIYLPNSSFNNAVTWPWEEVRNVSIDIESDSNGREINNMLAINPELPTGGSQWFSVQAPVGWLSRKGNHVYAISFDVRSGGAIERTFNTQLKLQNTYYTVAPITITNSQQRVVLTSDMLGSQFNTPEATPLSGAGFLSFGEPYNVDINSDRFTDKIYIDNVSMKSVLPVAADKRVARTCRLYPTGAAKSCDFSDAGGKEYRGWKGFCVEEDPKIMASNPEERLCLNWWPIDILPGEGDVFGTDKMAGYTGRKPLYYCLEAFYNYPYYRRSVVGSVKTGEESGRGWFRKFKASEYGFNGIYRDEILEVKINGIQIDKDESGDYDCGASRSYEGHDDSGFDFTKNPAIPGSSTPSQGTIVFNNTNKDYWSESLESLHVICNDNSDYDAKINPYAFIRCDGINKGDDCNDMNYFTARLMFDDNGMLDSIEVRYDDGGNETGRGKFENITITFVGPRCEVIAQVVDPEGNNYAWGKIGRNSWTKNNYLGYGYTSDYVPYGAAVVPAPDADPTQWGYPLYVMPPDTMNFQEPYQVRAGLPYSYSNIKGAGYCQRNFTTAPFKSCTEDSQCVGSIGEGPTKVNLYTGKCVVPDLSGLGKTQCVAGMAESLGNECNSSVDCGVSGEGGGYGLC